MSCFAAACMVGCGGSAGETAQEGEQAEGDGTVQQTDSLDSSGDAALKTVGEKEDMIVLKEDEAVTDKTGIADKGSGQAQTDKGDAGNGKNAGAENPGAGNHDNENAGAENHENENSGAQNPGDENTGAQNPGNENPGAEDPGADNTGNKKGISGGTGENDNDAGASDKSTGILQDERMSPEDFYISEIDDGLWQRIRGLSFKDDCPLSTDDLRYIHVLHRDIEGRTHEGEMIVNAHIAQDVLDILKQLYESGYPIERMKLVDEYGADDQRSMADNNSSGFNFRYISHTGKISKHGLGLAVDINTRYNPYVKTVDGKTVVEPANAASYVDRKADFPYKIEKGDLCYELFTSHGFEWGGNWKSVKDYQHFEVPDSRAKAWYPSN